MVFSQVVLNYSKAEKVLFIFPSSISNVILKTAKTESAIALLEIRSVKSTKGSFLPNFKSFMYYPIKY